MKRMKGIIVYQLELKKDQQNASRLMKFAAVMRKMKRHKAQGLRALVAEMTQATGDTATQWYWIYVMVL